jgi:hypothetical protein
METKSAPDLNSLSSPCSSRFHALPALEEPNMASSIASKKPKLAPDLNSSFS